MKEGVVYAVFTVSAFVCTPCKLFFADYLYKHTVQSDKRRITVPCDTLC